MAFSYSSNSLYTLGPLDPPEDITWRDCQDHIKVQTSSCVHTDIPPLLLQPANYHITASLKWGKLQAAFRILRHANGEKENATKSISDLYRQNQDKIAHHFIGFLMQGIWVAYFWCPNFVITNSCVIIVHYYVSKSRLQWHSVICFSWAQENVLWNGIDEAQNLRPAI